MRFFRFDRTWDHRFDAVLAHRLAERVAVISLVTEQLGDAVEQTDTCRPDCAVGGVARREDQDPRATQLIDKAVNLAVAVGRRLEDALPNSLRTPAVEAIVDRL